MKHLFRHWRGLLFSLMVLGAISTLTSCGNDEPQPLIVNYYIKVENEFLVNGSTDRTDRYLDPIARMKTAISTVYPVPNTKGNDEEVIAACDKEYETYLSFYNGVGEKEHLTCLFHLVRATMSNDIIKSNETLKTYNYNINPVVPEAE